MSVSKLYFSTIDVTRQAFYRHTLAYAIVNLKPILPGHVLVIPSRAVPRLTDLDASELSALMGAVQHVGRVIERVYGADGLTIACQDGKAAGQTVPHVHFHLLPRKLHKDRFSARNDEIYPALEHAEGTLPQELQYAAKELGGLKSDVETNTRTGFVEGMEPIKMDAEEDRKPRSMKEMIQEAEWLKTFFAEETKG